jgi:hypothetical protein
MNFFKKYDNIYYEDRKNMKFVLVKDPTQIIDFCNIHPDEANLFVKIHPLPNSQSRNSTLEKKYRIFVDLHTVVHLTPDTVENLSKILIDYLLEIEDYSRLCVVRDVKFYYEFIQEKKDKAIREALKKSQKNL